MKTLAEWLSFKDNGICRGELEGALGVWSYRLALDGGCPSESELRLFVANLPSERGWMHSSFPLGRENFKGFVRKWRRDCNAEQWIAFARTDGLGSIVDRNVKPGIKPPRPDFDRIEMWWLPEPKPKGQPLLAES